VKLSSVAEVCVPRRIVDETNALLRTAGHDRLEAFVVWGGTVRHERFLVGSLHVPEQRSVRTREGLHVSISGDALHALGVALSTRGEIPGVQLHSHPEAAYHSEVDDELAVVTKRGAISMVVPRFGRDGVEGDGVATYRLGPEGWCRLAQAMVDRLIVWDGDGTR
jgi:hypothetical protein